MTISSVAPAVPALASSPGPAGQTDAEGGEFAELLGTATPGRAGGSCPDVAALPAPAVDAGVNDSLAEGRAGATFPLVQVIDPTQPPAAPAPEPLSAAQIMAAAQVVPVTPVLAAALALQNRPAGTPPVAAADGAPVPATPTTGSTAGSAGGPVTPSVLASAVPLAAPAAEQAPAPTGEQPTQPGTPAAQPAGAMTPDPGPQDAAGMPAAPAPVRATSDTAAASTAGAGTTAPGASTPAPTAGETRAPEATDPRTRQGADPVGPLAPTQPSGPVSGTAARAEPTSPEQVNGQVFPEVARLVSRGDGTRRLTIKLSPEALGDVRVVLTVRDGDVHVRMTGSEQAQQALRAGAPELHRLLDLTGASSTQVVVGDQSSSLDAGSRDGASTQRNPEDHRTAGTRDGATSARDGVPGGPRSRPSSDPTATRGALTRTLAGVDVTM